jgi:hydroxymethylglutaryl-CoA synthase
LCFQFQNENLNTKNSDLYYGSGSKAKVFEAEVSRKLERSHCKVPLFETWSNSHEIDFGTYISLKRKKAFGLQPKDDFYLDYIERKTQF